MQFVLVCVNIIHVVRDQLNDMCSICCGWSKAFNNTRQNMIAEPISPENLDLKLIFAGKSSCDLPPGYTKMLFPFVSSPCWLFFSLNYCT